MVEIASLHIVTFTSASTFIHTIRDYHKHIHIHSHYPREPEEIITVTRQHFTFENLPTPCVLRYDSKYAALITVGVYKAKQNKKLVTTAQAEWKRTYTMKPGTLWMRHVKGHSDHPWNEEADRLAKLGSGGRRHCGAYAGGLARLKYRTLREQARKSEANEKPLSRYRGPGPETKQKQSQYTPTR